MLLVVGKIYIYVAFISRHPSLNDENVEMTLISKESISCQTAF